MTRLRIFVVTGQSGAGKSTALRVLEDLGYYCVDNLPSVLAPKLVEIAVAAGTQQLAYGIDVRLLRAAASTEPIGEAGRVVDTLRDAGHDVRVIFCAANEATLVRRFSETRRPHPLGAGVDLLEAIRQELEQLAPLRVRAEVVVDTTDSTVHDLRRRLVEVIGVDGAPMTTRLVSFGFKFGIPVDADLVFDVRYLANPHFVPHLKPRTGQDPEVARFVLETPEAEELFSHLGPMLAALLPRYAKEGKSTLTVAIGCTGGKHRSVAVAEALAGKLRARDRPVVVQHRDAARA